jgi:transcriptional regulator with GAF, ATPase, and Fis domain
VESELFGREKGAYTGAMTRQIGRFEVADASTLFLDEVGELSLEVQAKLLRVLQEGQFERLGSPKTIKVNVRVIAATNRDLTEDLRAGRFRKDLYYRLNVFPIRVPPLRERAEDIRALIEHHLSRARRRINLTEEALLALETYRWPGNVRELQNVIERLIWTSVSDVVGIEDLPTRLLQGRIEGAPPVRERRRQRADDLYRSLSDGSMNFWEHVHPLFLDRDLTRHDLRELVRRGLAATRGNYQAMVRLFGMQGADYKRFLNFLGTHDCVVDFREFRTTGTHEETVVKVPASPKAGPARGGKAKRQSPGSS